MQKILPKKASLEEIVATCQSTLGILKKDITDPTYSI